MKNTILVTTLLLMQLMLFSHKKSTACKNKYIKLKGKVTSTQSFCGGAQPSQEMLQKLETPKPTAAKTMYLKIGSRNTEKTPVYKKMVTDENGEFEVTVKKGNVYLLVEEWKSIPFALPPTREFVTWDEVCFRKSYETPDFIIDTKKKIIPVITINYHKPCFYNPYCGKYSGPLPP